MNTPKLRPSLAAADSRVIRTSRTAVIAGAIVGWIGWFIARKLFWADSDNFSDQVAIMTAAGWMIGFWIGIGAFNAPFRWLLGNDNSRDDDLYYAGYKQGRARYWKYTTDHKVVGIQYIVVTMSLLAVGGILAMAIRTELIVPGTHFVNQQVYNSFIAIHGMVMILALIVAVAGPWGNFVMPIMVGARDMAFPRLNASQPLDARERGGASRHRLGGGWSAGGLGGLRYDRRPGGSRNGLLRDGHCGLYRLDDSCQYQPDYDALSLCGPKE